MEIHRRQKAKSSGDIFSFPAISHNTQFQSELADQLFSNGKLLLHTFPTQQSNHTFSRSMILSRTSSINSKDSLMSSMSSRSNSTNSRSSGGSSCNSSRTSTSEASSEKKLLSPINRTRSVAIGNAATRSKKYQSRYYSNSYGSSRRWQFIAPVPVLNRRSSSRKRKGGNGKREGGRRKGFCRRFFGWIVSTCQECHAMEPSKRKRVLKGSMGLQ